jgi:hypothetical protein
MQHDPSNTISLAVWDVPMPAIAGEKFSIKVGAKSASGDALTGGRIEVTDSTGSVVVATASLSKAPLPETEALYWTSIDIPAPAQQRFAEYAVRLVPGPGVSAQHAVATRFSITVAAKPEHKLTVRVTEQTTAEALGGVEVRVGVFGGRTDAAGRAELRVCKGEYQLQLFRTAHIAPDKPIDIKGDASVELTMLHVPEDHPDARWVR